MRQLCIKAVIDEKGKLKYALSTNLNPLIVLGILHKIEEQESQKMPLNFKVKGNMKDESEKKWEN